MGLDSTTPSRELAESERVANFQRQIYRKWQQGDVYAPHDLSGTEQKKWKYGRKKPQQDAFDVLGVNPVLEYKVCGNQSKGKAVGGWNEGESESVTLTIV